LLGVVGVVGIPLRVEMGDPAGEIARRARQQGPGLVVVGAATGDAGAPAVEIARRLLASVRCSVLVVRLP
jgi:nucleotide-binding universal stress UspA family protein